MPTADLFCPDVHAERRIPSTPGFDRGHSAVEGYCNPANSTIRRSAADDLALLCLLGGDDWEAPIERGARRASEESSPSQGPTAGWNTLRPG